MRWIIFITIMILLIAIICLILFSLISNIIILIVAGFSFLAKLNNWFNRWGADEPMSCKHRTRIAVSLIVESLVVCLIAAAMLLSCEYCWRVLHFVWLFVDSSVERKTILNFWNTYFSLRWRQFVYLCICENTKVCLAFLCKQTFVFFLHKYTNFVYLCRQNLCIWYFGNAPILCRLLVQRTNLS